MKLDYNSFLNNLIAQTSALGLDLFGAKLDHIAYQAASSEEYDTLKPEIEKLADPVREAIVGGRRVGIFKFKKPQTYKNYTFEAIELIEPKEGQTPKSGLEHAEFLLPVSLEDYVQKYPDVNWKKDHMNREEFPMLILRLTEDMQVKFPRFPVL